MSWLSIVLRCVVLAMSSVGAAVCFWATVPALVKVGSQNQWAPVSAQLERVADSTGHNGAGSGPFVIDVRYRYHFAGRIYTSQQLSLDGHLPSSLAAQRDHYRTLADAERTSRPITAYVNPHDPREAVLQRDLGAAVWFVALIGAALLVVFIISVRVMWPKKYRA
jgi:hypothetical protein